MIIAYLISKSVQYMKHFIYHVTLFIIAFSRIDFLWTELHNSPSLLSLRTWKLTSAPQISTVFGKLDDDMHSFKHRLSHTLLLFSTIVAKVSELQ